MCWIDSAQASRGVMEKNGKIFFVKGGKGAGGGVEAEGVGPVLKGCKGGGGPGHSDAPGHPPSPRGGRLGVSVRVSPQDKRITGGNRM